jgi:hypothetical protein
MRVLVIPLAMWAALFCAAKVHNTTVLAILSAERVDPFH